MSKKNSEKFEELEFEIDISQLLLHSRNILLHGVVDVDMSKKICEDLIGLNELSNKPIALWINTRGGSIDSGFAIIDTILGLKSPVYTFICGTASSVGALISIAGTKRVITEHSNWMIHDLAIGCYPDGEYVTKMDARMTQYNLPMWKVIKEYIKENTKLTEEDIERAKNGELTLLAKQAKAKGVVDFIAKKRRVKSS